MELIHGQANLENRLQNCVVTIGNFDGIHLGHQKLLSALQKKAHELNLPSVLIIFEPQPNEFFYTGSPKPRLMRFREKWLALRDYQIDYVLCLRFSENLSKVTAEDFVKEILVNEMGMKAIVVGDDFRFGSKKTGNFALLQKLGAKYGFSATQLDTHQINGERVSSTKVRDALMAGDLPRVSQLLGRNYRLCGKVAHGEKRGRELGFPTANINLHRDYVPLTGVYAVRVFGINDDSLNGVANIGVRPTFNGQRVLLEVFLFDFNREIYGYNLEVEFLKKLRDEKRYADFKELIRQIQKDIKNAKNYFSTRSKRDPA